MKVGLMFFSFIAYTTSSFSRGYNDGYSWRSNDAVYDDLEYTQFDDYDMFYFSQGIYGSRIVRNPIPYQASIKLDHKICGGALISLKWILTAGDCLIDTETAIITLGAKDISPGSNEESVVNVRSNTFFVHPAYKQNEYEDNIGMILLPFMLELTESVKPIEMAKPGSWLFSGDMATLSGWGIVYGQSRTSPDILHYMNLEVLDNYDCGEFFLSDFSKRILCTRAGTMKDASCRGDSGSPLVSTRASRQPLLIGILAFGYPQGRCGSKGPTGYMRVSEYWDWIQNKLTDGRHKTFDS